MVFLKSFELLDAVEEHYLLEEDKRKIYNSPYPLNMFPPRNLKEINFENITIFYGGNGSGKTTLLNIISEKIEAIRKNKIDKGNYFRLYTNKCDYKFSNTNYETIKMIASDDIFDYLLDVRAINSNVNRKKEELSKDYINKMMSLEMKLTTKKEQLEQLQEEGKKLEKESATTLIRFDKEKDPSSKEENEYNKLLNEYQTLKSKFHGVIELNIFYKEKFQKLENELNDIENQIALLNKEYSEL